MALSSSGSPVKFEAEPGAVGGSAVCFLLLACAGMNLFVDIIKAAF